MKTTTPAAPKLSAAPRPRHISRREAQHAAARLTTDAYGRVSVVRFSLAQRVEHQLLIVSFTALAVTGLAQRFATEPLGGFLLALMGGIDLVRQIHRLFALLFVLQALYHLVAFVYNYVLYGRRGSLWPNRADLTHLIQMVRYNLGRSSQLPNFGRYSFEEKVEYWALVWGSAVMILTGFMQAFPIAFTYVLPGDVIPIARAIHGWEAILAVSAIIVWHMYHTVIKKRNVSIFTGHMTEEEMEEEHPAELAYLKQAAAALVAVPGEAAARSGDAPTTAPAEAVQIDPDPLTDHESGAHVRSAGTTQPAAEV